LDPDPESDPEQIRIHDPGLNPFLKILTGVLFLLLVLPPRFFAVKIFSANGSQTSLILMVLEIRRVIEGSLFVITERHTFSLFSIFFI
jgi:hypothetical protein